MEKKSRNQRWKRNAVLFILSQSVTLFGSSIVQMAIIWQVALETSSGLWVTLLTLSATIPQTLLSFFSGVWADRYPRKRLIILADLGVAAATFILALFFLSGADAFLLPAIVIVSVIRSIGTGIQTPAVSAVIPQIVPEEGLMRYNGLNGSMMSIVQFAAPAAAGAILYIGPFHWVLFIDVITAIAGIFILFLVKIPPVKSQAQDQKESFLTDLRAGVVYAAKDKNVRGLLLIFGAFIFLCVPSGFLAVLMIERTFGSSYIYLTVTEMAGFAGMVLGGVGLGLWGGFKNRRKTLLFGLAGYGLCSLILGISYIFWLFALLMFLTSLFIPVIQSTITTMLQEHVPEDKQGRIFGLLGTMYSGFMPVGMAIFGPLADIIKIQAMVAVCGVIMIITALWSWIAGRNPCVRL